MAKKASPPPTKAATPLNRAAVSIPEYESTANLVVSAQAAQPVHPVSSPAGTKPLHLSISSHVVVQLGAELVTDVEQALLELAKNAYDADAETCEVVIEPHWELEPSDPAYDRLFPRRQGAHRVPEAVGRVQVVDDGVGIPANSIESGWLRISASLKRPQGGDPKSRTGKGRVPVGDKGLGRLATMKIGSVLRMRSTRAGEKTLRSIMFSWRDFTPERALEDVPVADDVLPFEPADQSGTAIEMIGLSDRSEWTDERRIERKIVPKLSSLVSPFLEEAGFSIQVRYGTKLFELQRLSDDVLNLAAAKFAFSWDGRRMRRTVLVSESLFRGTSGENYESNYQRALGSDAKPFLKFLREKSLGKRGMNLDVPRPWLFSLAEEEEFEGFPSDRDFPGAADPGPFKAEINNFLFNQATKDQLQVAGMSSAAIQEMATIAIYRDGFRVRGEKDWLRLAGSGTKGGSFYELKPNNVVGYFAITNEQNPLLLEKSDREGFVDNAQFRGFMLLATNCKEYANGVLETLRRAYNKFIAEQVPAHARPASPQRLFRHLQEITDPARPQLQRAQSTITSTIARLKANRSLLKGMQADEVDAVVDGLEEASASISQQLSGAHELSSAAQALHVDQSEMNVRLLEAAAVGMSARALAHELHTYVRQLREAIANIEKRTAALGDPVVKSSLRQLSNTARELSKTVSSIDPLMPGSRTVKEKIHVVNAVEEFLASRASRLAASGVSCQVERGPGAEELVVRFSRPRFIQILENLLANSLYWLDRGPSSDPGRGIYVTCTSRGFVWADTGPGVRPSLEDSLFEPFVSDKPASEGQGLGLHIISTFLALERCSISLGPERNSLGRKYQFLVDLDEAAVGTHKLLKEVQ